MNHILSLHNKIVSAGVPISGMYKDEEGYHVQYLETATEEQKIISENLISSYSETAEITALQNKVDEYTGRLQAVIDALNGKYSNASPALNILITDDQLIGSDKMIASGVLYEDVSMFGSQLTAIKSTIDLLKHKIAEV